MVASWVDGLIEELASFPNGAHDDQVDALTQALNRMRTPALGGLIQLWRQQAAALKAGDPGAAVAPEEAGLTRAEIVGARQKAMSTDWKTPPRGVRKALPAPAPRLCPECGAPVSETREAWKCNLCGAAGSLAAAAS
jgi:hypothetical protein